MPPHCDSLDGPVVTAARRSLEHDDVSLVLPYVPADAEHEVEDTFARAIKVRGQGAEAREVADRLFFETVVRLHRAGEGAPYTGLKPAGLDVGPVIPVCERAIEDNDSSALIALLTGIVRDEAQRRFDEMVALRAEADKDVAHARAYVTAMLGLQVWAHMLALAAHEQPHGDAHEHHH